nr:hypothetical protein GCM10020093_108460 [Planobispora longispora]
MERRPSAPTTTGVWISYVRPSRSLATTPATLPRILTGILPLVIEDPGTDDHSPAQAVRPPERPTRTRGSPP